MRKKETDKDKVSLKSVHRALEVLKHLAIQASRPTDLAEDLGVSWATLHRTLAQLEHSGFIIRDADSNRYTIGPRMWFIGTAYPSRHALLRIAKPYIDATDEGPDMLVQLVERMERLAVTLYSHRFSDRLVPPSTGDPLIDTRTYGTYDYHFPLHCGSKGQVLLAYSDEDFIEEYLAGELEQITPDTVTHPDTLRNIIRTIRENGYAKTEGDVQSFTGSVGAPIFDANHNVVASVTMIVLRNALRDPAYEEHLVEKLLQTTHSISIALGWRPRGRLK